MTDLTTNLLQPHNLLLLSFTAACLTLKPKGGVREARLLLAAQVLTLCNATLMTELGQMELTACSALVSVLVTGYALTRRQAALHPWLHFTPAPRPALIPIRAGRS